MKSFINECVESLYSIHKDAISDLHILLPTQRAKSFFKMELASKIKDRPIWQPSFLSVNELMSKVTSLKSVDKIRLITELYSVYSRYHNETLDKFYYWGGILVSDFSTLDNYKCDASLLFSNVSDLKEIEDRFDYLSEEQKGMIFQFWGVFKDKHKHSKSQKEFLKLWNTLFNIYTEYKALLESKGIGYSGMIYRKAAEIIDNKEGIEYLNEKKIVVIGFNALSATEMTLFDYFKNKCDAQFYWDYDNYYIDNKAQEAGLFIRENIKRYGEVLTSEPRDNFVKDKNIVVISSPSEALGCKYTSNYLKELAASQGSIGRETAIILTNEALLSPLLYSIPSEIEHFNVTSGYPLRLTSAYLLVEYLLSLRASSTNRAGEEIHYYQKEVFKIVNHPYIQYVLTAEEQDLFTALHKESLEQFMAYIPVSRVAFSPLTSLLFKYTDNPLEFYDHIEELFISMMEINGDNFDKENIEYINKTLESIINLRASVANCTTAITMPIACSLLQKHLSTVNTTFEGEPLIGMQVMGILESRNLDFENVVIMSMSEDNYPSIKNILSLIPSNLRFGYGLPTISNHEAMYSYYFYRLIQRAKNIHIIYSSYSGESLSGEPSRYIHQLKIESPHKESIVTKNINLKIISPKINEIVISKEGKPTIELNKFLDGKRHLSASRLFEYIECPLKFYFTSIEHIKVEQELEEELDAATSGTILHAVLHTIYNDVKESNIEIEEALNDDIIHRELIKEIEGRLGICEAEFNGRLKSKLLELNTYIRNIISYDINGSKEFDVIHLEEKITTSHTFGDKEVSLSGEIDRIDRLTDGTIRIIDYKSGKSKLSTKSLEESMTTDSGSCSKPIFQTLFYSLLYKSKNGGDIQPSLYFARDINAPDYSPLLTIAKEPLYKYSGVEKEFTELFDQSLSSLFDLSHSFYQTTDESICQYCNYNKICRKEA